MELPKGYKVDKSVMISKSQEVGVGGYHRSQAAEEWRRTLAVCERLDRIVELITDKPKRWWRFYGVS